MSYWSVTFWPPAPLRWLMYSDPSLCSSAACTAACSSWLNFTCTCEWMWARHTLMYVLGGVSLRGINCKIQGWLAIANQCMVHTWSSCACSSIFVWVFEKLQGFKWRIHNTHLSKTVARLSFSRVHPHLPLHCPSFSTPNTRNSNRREISKRKESKQRYLWKSSGDHQAGEQRYRALRWARGRR